MTKQDETKWVPARLVRNLATNYYVLVFGEETPLTQKHGIWSGSHVVKMCDHKFESLFPQRLKPGEGPIEVEVAIRVRKD